MTPLALFRTSWSSIGGNRLRTALTLLGMIIGVAAVISLMSIGRGAQESITSRIESLGSNLLYVRPSDGDLTLEDALALTDPVFTPSIVSVAPELSVFASVTYLATETSTQVFGVTSEFAAVRNFEVLSGEFISPAHMLNRNNVAVLGSQTAEDLFGERDPVGVDIAISGVPFTVVGVLGSKGGNSFGNEDDRVLVPLTTAFYRLSGQRTTHGDITVSTINVQADGERLEEAQREAATLLRLRHEVTDSDDFTIATQQSVIDTLSETTGTLTVFLGAVAGISLIVGGIGIMNIMLVSVTDGHWHPQSAGRQTARHPGAVRHGGRAHQHRRRGSRRRRGRRRIEEAQREAATLLRLRHEVTDSDDFTIATQQSVIDTLSGLPGRSPSSWGRWRASR